VNQIYETEPHIYNSTFWKGLRSMGHISLRNAENVIQGAGFAAQIDAPLNRHFIISWEVAGFQGRVKEAQRHLLDLARHWLSPRGHKLTYVYAIETGHKLGYHLHLVIHLPDELIRQFDIMLRHSWIPRITGESYVKGSVKMTKDTQKRENYHQSKRDLLRYILKGVNQEASEILGWRPREGAGFVSGKRCGTSQNIGPRARANHQHKSAA